MKKLILLLLLSALPCYATSTVEDLFEQASDMTLEQQNKWANKLDRDMQKVHKKYLGQCSGNIPDEVFSEYYKTSLAILITTSKETKRKKQPIYDADNRLIGTPKQFYRIAFEGGWDNIDHRYLSQQYGHRLSPKWRDYLYLMATDSYMSYDYYYRDTAYLTPDNKDKRFPHIKSINIQQLIEYQEAYPDFEYHDFINLLISYQIQWLYEVDKKQFDELREYYKIKGKLELFDSLDTRPTCNYPYPMSTNKHTPWVI